MVPSMPNLPRADNAVSSSAGLRTVRAARATRKPPWATCDDVPSGVFTCVSPLSTASVGQTSQRVRSVVRMHECTDVRTYLILDEHQCSGLPRWCSHLVIVRIFGNDSKRSLKSDLRKLVNLRNSELRERATHTIPNFVSGSIHATRKEVCDPFTQFRIA